MKKCLIVVDYQNDFVDGVLGFPGAERLEGPIAEKIAKYRAEDGEVIFTLDTHGEDYLQTGEGKSLPIPHCLRGSQGHSLYGRVADMVMEGDPIFEKPTFGSAELLEHLKAGEYESIELVGLVSYMCVMANAVIAKSAQPDVSIIVDAACSDGPDRGMSEKAYDALEGIYITVLNR